MSFSPIASFMAAADLFGRTEGDIVKRVSKDDAVSTRLFDRRAEGLIEAMAYEVDVKERACLMSCFSLASTASIMREETEREGIPRLFCADMRFIRSHMCCRESALDTEVW